MIDNKAQTIKDRLIMRDVLERYGFNLSKSMFVCCPFHNENTPSLKIYEKDYHCFGCGAHGDIITFVQKLFDIPFTDALRKLDVDFNLNLYANKTFEELRKSYYADKHIKAKRQREKAEKQIAETEYWKVFDEWKRLDDNKKKYAPATINEELHPLFIEALQKLSHQEYLLDCAEERRKQYA